MEQAPRRGRHLACVMGMSSVPIFLSTYFVPGRGILLCSGQMVSGLQSCPTLDDK